MNTPVKAPAFQFYAADHLADERVMLMSLEEEGAYLRLLCLCWREGSIPADAERLGILCKGASTTVVAALMECFKPHPENPDRLIHPRLEEQRAAQREWREKSAEGGRKSAAKRLATAHKPPAKGASKGGSTLHASSSPSSSDNTPLPPRGDEPNNDLFPGNPGDPPIAATHPQQQRLPDALRHRIGGLLGRRPGTTWSPKELKALRPLLPIDPADLELLEAYYLANIPEEKDFRRRSLLRLLVHWHGELDHARHFEALQPQPC